MQNTPILKGVKKSNINNNAINIIIEKIFSIFFIFFPFCPLWELNPLRTYKEEEISPEIFFFFFF